VDFSLTLFIVLDVLNGRRRKECLNNEIKKYNNTKKTVIIKIYVQVNCALLFIPIDIDC
jgi:hypothetical protein